MRRGLSAIWMVVRRGAAAGRTPGIARGLADDKLPDHVLQPEKLAEMAFGETAWHRIQHGLLVWQVAVSRATHMAELIHRVRDICLEFPEVNRHEFRAADRIELRNAVRGLVPVRDGFGTVGCGGQLGGAA